MLLVPVARLSSRGANFVTRKITRAVAQISLGQLDTLVLGNLDATRDWGHARDYVLMMWMMLQQDEYNDFDIVLDDTSRIFRLCRPKHAVWCALLRYHAQWMLIGACNPTLCPISGFRPDDFVISTGESHSVREFVEVQ